MPSTSDVIVSGLEFYTVSANTPIGLQIVIGDGQPGGTSYDCADQSGQIIDQNNHKIGKQGNSLAGEILHCVTTVKDMSDNNNRTSVTYTLSGGPADQSYPFKAEARQDRGMVIYSIRFFLMAEA